MTASFAAAAALALASTVAGATSAQALPRAMPVEVHFRDLRPGSSASTSWALAVPRHAQVAQVAVTRTGTGVARWTATLCPSSGAACINLLAAVRGTSIPAGVYTLRVGVTMVDLDPGDTQSLEARYLLSEREAGPLAATGTAASTLAALAGAAAAAGILLAALGRRRRALDDEPAATTTPASSRTIPETTP